MSGKDAKKRDLKKKIVHEVPSTGSMSVTSPSCSPRSRSIEDSFWLPTTSRTRIRVCRDRSVGSCKSHHDRRGCPPRPRLNGSP